jgi:hypothetical protein
MAAPNSTGSKQINMPVVESWQTNARLVTGRSNTKLASGILPIPTNQQGLPRSVSNLSASTIRKTVGGAKMTQVNVTHKISSSDTAFQHANIWITGLNGSPNPQLQSASTASPHTLLLPTQGQKVSLTVQSVGKDGSLLDLPQCPSTSVII